MVAAGMCRHAFGRLRCVQTKHRVAGAAHLEGARLLKVLTLKKQLRPGQLVQIGRGADWRAADVRRNPLMRRQHVLIGGDIHRAVLHHAASCCAEAALPR